VLFAQAWLSQGYFHPDEYFQTVEFASYKLGVTAQAELPWEFAERMRPFLQPATYYALARA
jgi:phosphatidylinositol glycan class B